MKRRSWQPEPESDPGKPSKSQVKRDLLDLQDVALRLLDIPPTRLDALQADERLCDALADLRRISNLPARRRQARYVAKLLRNVDLEPLRRELAATRPGKG